MQYRTSGTNQQQSSHIYRKPNTGTQQGSNASVAQAPIAARTCYNCKEVGHMVANCPYNKPKQVPANTVARTANSGAGRGGQQASGQQRKTQSFGRGHVNHIDAIEAEESPDVVI